MHKITFTQTAKTEMIEAFASRRVPVVLAETAFEKVERFGLSYTPIFLTDDVYYHGIFMQNYRDEYELEMYIERDLFAPHYCCPPVYQWVQVRALLVRSVDDQEQFDLVEKPVVTSADGGPWQPGLYGIVGLFPSDHPRFVERTAELTALCLDGDGGGGGRRSGWDRPRP